MKICKIYIKGFQQFQDIELDFTNPETGEPLDKVCFIGSNGTGKSTLLRIVERILDYITNHLLSADKSFVLEHKSEKKEMDFFLVIKVVKNMILLLESNGKRISILICANHLRKYLVFSPKKIGFETLVSSIKKTNDLPDSLLDFSMSEEDIYGLFKEIGLKIDSNDLVIYSPAETIKNGYNNIDDVPKTTVNEALELSKSYPYYAQVSSDTVNVFWKLLVYNLRKRAEERDAYENQPENLIKIKQQLIEEFNAISPKILEHLNLVWEKILSKSGLYFDVKGANNPYQLNDNLKAYIKLKVTDEIIPYSDLSTGIRNFIFRVGHIFSLYFNREIDRGFLLVDEPENSLFPDFLFDLVEIYQQIIIDKRGQNNTQMFFATHNPIIAAQFKPYERIILDWNDDGTVFAKKGISPVGDDPNDILSNDFELKDLMGPEGREMWEKYTGLKKKLIRSSNDVEKTELIHEIEKIGSLYNFN